MGGPGGVRGRPKTPRLGGHWPWRSDQVFQPLHPKFSSGLERGGAAGRAEAEMAEGGGTGCGGQSPERGLLLGTRCPLRPCLREASLPGPLGGQWRAGDLVEREGSIWPQGFRRPWNAEPSPQPHSKVPARGREYGLWCGHLPFPDFIISYAGVRSGWPPAKPAKHEAPMFGGRGRVLARDPSSSQQGEGGETPAPLARPSCRRTGLPQR